MTGLRTTAVRGVAMWSVFQPDRGLDFNSWLVQDDRGSFIVDPLPADETVFAAARGAGVRTIVVTNRDHQRAAAVFAAELGAEIWAPVADAHEITAPVSRTLRDGDDVFGWNVLVLDGFKTAGECVLHDPGRRAAISGDAFWGAPAGALRLMPDEKLRDPRVAVRSSRRILALSLEALLVGDGAPLFRDAAGALGELVAQRTQDSETSRIE